MRFPSRDLTSQYISSSYQDVLQQFTQSQYLYILDGYGNVVASIPSASIGNTLITSDVTSSMTVFSASFSSNIQVYQLSSSFSSHSLTSDASISSSWASHSFNSDSSSYAILSTISLVADVALIADTASVSILSDTSSFSITSSYLNSNQTFVSSKYSTNAGGHIYWVAGVKMVERG